MFFLGNFLEKSFSDEQKEIFEKFHDCRDEYVSLAETAIFEYAVKLGMQKNCCVWSKLISIC